MDYQTTLVYCDTYQRIRRSARIQATKGSLMPDGLQTMCEGGGMANATIIERL
jgi:acetyl-CoA acetyltransferase